MRDQTVRRARPTNTHVNITQHSRQAKQLRKSRKLSFQLRRWAFTVLLSVSVGAVLGLVIKEIREPETSVGPPPATAIYPVAPTERP